MTEELVFQGILNLAELLVTKVEHLGTKIIIHSCSA